LARQDPDHRRLDAVQSNRSPDDARVGAEPFPPVRIGENRDIVGLVGRLFFGERPSITGPRPSVEKKSGDTRVTSTRSVDPGSPAMAVPSR
jgi:hypothetical protein